ncbi:hypothetical protein RUM44_006184 [Polyplax serrata]|uniref:Vacuolar protein sorting-associated protein 16 homolog n=1 Tax=Polyplax serrata TaxID=468196 RepID=A0ABR1AZ87_POLSC
MEWPNDLDIDNIVVSAAPYGGPIAVMRDRKKLIKVQTAGKPIIQIFSAPGYQISSILWNNGTLIQIGWSSEEELLCLKDDGTVLIYDMFGTRQGLFTMGEDVSVTKIIEAKIFPSVMGTGIAVLTSKYRVFLVNSVKDPKVKQFPQIPNSSEPLNGWEIISERETSVIISKGKDLFLLKQSVNPIRKEPNFSENYRGIIDMCVSLDNKHLALLSDSMMLWLGSTDLEKKYCEVNTNCTSRPKQIVWCSADAVIVNCGNQLFIVERGGASMNFYTTPVYLVPEIDGVRILGSNLHEMIQKVPQVTKKIFGINSTEPGSYLLEASKQYEKKSHTSYEYIDLVRENLEKAVDQCVMAAGFEFDSTIQKLLLRAAKFGKTIAPDIPSEPYVQMCRILRVLNGVRGRKIGIPLTTLLDRLVVRRQYKWAIEVAKYLRLPEEEGSSRILAHWACYKVKQTHLDEEQVAIEMAEKLGYAPGVSYSVIASKAADAGRTQLAIKLLDFEPQAAVQVPLLLRLGQQKPALIRALDSGNTDLVHTVMLKMRETMPLADFQMTIRAFPIAQSLYLKYCRENMPETLRDIYSQEDDYLSQAACFIREFYDPKNSSRDASLMSAIECCVKAKNEFLSGVFKEEQKLLSYQRNLEEKFRRNFVGISLHDTVELLLNLQEIKLAEKLRSEFKVPDRRYWWLRLKTLAEAGDWTEIEKFSKIKSPVGYEPFVDICLQYGNQSEAKKYVGKVSSELRVKYYVKLNLIQQAMQHAVEQKDLDALLYVKSNAGTSDQALLEELNGHIAQLSKRSKIFWSN